MPNLNPRVIGDLPYPNRSATSHAGLSVGGIQTAAPPTTPGSGYEVGETLTVTVAPFPGQTAVIQIATVDANGGILTLNIVNPGSNYQPLPTPLPVLTNPAVTAGTGAVYAAVTITAIVPVVKGRIYVADGNGNLVVPPTVAASSDPNLLSGIMQARTSTSPGDGFTKVQVVVPPSRIILRAEPGLALNEKVRIDIIDTNNVNQEKVRLSSSTFSIGFIGRIFEVETKNPDGSKKVFTEDNDLVVIDLGASQ